MAKKNIDFVINLIYVRDGKGRKNRTTAFQQQIKEELRLQITKVQTIHKKDLSDGFGKVYLPNVLSDKNTSKEPGWQYLFPVKFFKLRPKIKQRLGLV
jgi:hypothetical protein